MKRLLFLFVLLLSAALSRGQAISASIDAGKVGDPISPYLYGQFLEHLRNTVNTNIWAEMLDDRKFYNAITSRQPQSAPARGSARGRGFAPRRWGPIGPDDAVTMDTKNPYTGLHTPLITLDARTPHGISQSGLAIRSGKHYVGHIALAGDPSATVTISLAWSGGEHNITPLDKLTHQFQDYPLDFTAGADSEDARLDIVGTGSGSFHIGAVTLMPADNIQGFRKDVIDVLKQLHSGVYRFPGGNFISNFEWRDSVGPRDRRPPDWDFAWNAIQPNDVGLDEFMVLFKLIGVDPYITLNAGFGDENSAAQLVEYANGSIDTPMGKYRAANGHAEPYGIKLWGIGNEMYGDWQLGVMPPDQYQKKHNIFAAAMRKVDPSITLVGSGAMVDEMTVTLQGKRLDGQVLTQIGSHGDWTGGLLRNCLPNIDIISEHAYVNSGQVFDVATGKYVDVPNDSLSDWVRRPANRAEAKYEAYEEYLNAIPGMKNRHITISLDEYSVRNAPAGQYRTSMAYAVQFQELFRHTDVFSMAAFTFATACMTESRTDAVLNPVGLVFKMYADHFGNLPIEVDGNSPQPAPKYPVGGDQPKVNAGSPTFPLDISAALTTDRKSLTVAVINTTETAQSLDLKLQNDSITGPGHEWYMAPSNLFATNRVGEPPAVTIQDKPADAPTGTIAIAPFSMNIFVWPVK